MEDKEITCRDCGTVFTFSKEEQEYFQARNLHEPARCKSCIAAKKARNNNYNNNY